jgi:hypothetical protein
MNLTIVLKNSRETSFGCTGPYGAFGGHDSKELLLGPAKISTGSQNRGFSVPRPNMTTGSARSPPEGIPQTLFQQTDFKLLFSAKS